jgi:hypothetical protein
MTLRRVLVLVPLLALVPLTGSAVAAPARLATAQTIGQSSGPSAGGCPANLTVVQHTTVTSPSYEVSTAGVVTSFSYLSNGVAGQVRALLFTKTATNTFQLVGKSALQTAAASTLNTFPTRIPVPAGALLGGQVSSSAMQCAFSAVTSGDEFKAGAFDPDSSATMTTTGSYTGRWDISAVVESDADGDGYGDVTQDLCPSSSSTHAACAAAPDTTVTKAPKKKSTKRKSTIKFTSTVAGSTFTCKVDKKPAAPCTSPFKKKYKYGKHTVVVTATSPFGIVDPTPATVKFKVTRPTG